MKASSVLRGSIPTKLTLIALAMLLALATVRVITLDRIAEIDEVSADVRNHWLDAIRIVGDLRQRIASIRTEEFELLVTVPPLQRTFDLLNRNMDAVVTDIDAYRAFSQDSEEDAAFQSFLAEWGAHAPQANRIAALVRSGQSAGALALMQGSAQESFFRASDALRRLADITTTKADEARRLAAEGTEHAEQWVSGTLFCAILLFAGLVFYLWRSLSRPLLELAKRMRLLASYDTNDAVPFQARRDEIGEMARALAVFRSNKIELLDSRKSLRGQAAALTGTLERERALVSEEHNFIRTMSHEFRTPLTRIDGQAQRLLARKDHADPAELAERASRIRTAVAIMADLVASLTASIEQTSGASTISNQNVDLRAILRDVVIHHRGLGGDTIEENVAALPGIIGDPALLHLAFSNLVSNAVKYSPEGHPVVLSATVFDGGVAIVVEDSGVGIPAGEVERVRERYFRGSNAGSISGTGVGLHLVDQIVRRHGGDLSIESELGHGTRVIVRLPIGPAIVGAELAS